MGVDEEWQMFLKDENISFTENVTEDHNIQEEDEKQSQTDEIPECEELSISTKTKVLY